MAGWCCQLLQSFEQGAVRQKSTLVRPCCLISARFPSDIYKKENVRQFTRVWNWFDDSIISEGSVRINSELIFFSCGVLRRRRGTAKRQNSGLLMRRQTTACSHLLLIATYSNTRTECQGFLLSFHPSPQRSFSFWKHFWIKSRILSRGTRPSCWRTVARNWRKLYEPARLIWLNSEETELGTRRQWMALEEVQGLLIVIPRSELDLIVLVCVIISFTRVAIGSTG